jgi:hypothetical protein
MCLFYNVGRGEDLTEKMSFEEWSENHKGR